MKKRVFSLWPVLLVLTFTTEVLAQASLGQITGSVRDSSGGVIPGATVTATNVNTGVTLETTTNESGIYRFLNLLVGGYTVTASQDGFQSVKKSDLRVFLGETLTVDIELPVGAAETTITVTGGSGVLDTTSTTTGTTISDAEISDIPIQLSGTNRNIRDYISVLPGVKQRDGAPDVNNHAQLQGVGDTGGFRSVAGYKVDGTFAGGSINQALGEGRAQVPIPDQVQEVRVVTNADAEYGGDMGASMEVVLKSGTNQYHGSLFEILRNEALDARAFTAARASFNRQHEYGGSLGGPILRNKHFFFFTIDQYFREFAQTGITRTFPTARMKGGDFSEWLGPQIGTDALGRPVFQGQIYDPATTRPDGNGGFIRDPFMYNGQLNVIDPARISPISQFLQKYYQDPTRAGVADNWVGTARPVETPRRAWNVKTDHHFGNHRLSPFFEYVRDRAVPQGENWPPPEINGERELRQHAFSSRLNYTWVMRPTLLFTARGAVNWGKGSVQNPAAASNIGAEAGVPGFQTPETPFIALGGTAQNMGTAQPFVRFTQQSTPIRVDATAIKGTHEMKFGMDYLHIYFRQDVGENSNGSFTFAARGTNLPLSSLNTGNAYASFLLGQVDTSSVRTPSYNKYYASNFALFAQDKWRVTPKLTLNYGVRWDVYTAPSELEDRIASFDPTVPNPGAGGRPGALTFWGEGEGRNGLHNLVETIYTNIGPRVGAAYVLDKVGVVRAYYGLQFFPISALATGGRQLRFNSFGWGALLNPTTTDSGVTPAFDWDNGFPVAMPNLPVLDPALQNNTAVTYYSPFEDTVGSAQNFGLSVERDLPWGLSAKVAYVGKLSKDMPTDQLVGLNQLPLEYLSLGPLLSQNINSAAARAAGIPIPYAGFNGTVQQALRPFPQFLDIAQANAMVSDARYHSAEITVRKRVGKSLHFLAAYTIAKEMVTDVLAGGGSGHPGVVDIPHSSLRDRAWMVSYTTDRPQYLVLSWGYELPFGQGRTFLSSAGPVLDQIVNGWRISAVQTYGSGVPIRILGASRVPTAGPSGVVLNPDVPILTGLSCGDYDPGDPNARYLNSAAFSEPAPFTLGDTRVLSNVRGCGIAREDLALTKRFRISRGVNMELSARFFNVLNRHTWTNFGTSINLPATFGRSTTVTAPRTGQVALTVTF